MNDLTIKFSTPEIKTAFDWQLFQEVNLFDGDTLIAKAEFEILTLNKHRDAKASYQALSENDATDWEIPLNLFFKNQNLNSELCQQFDVKPESKKSAQHIMIEALSVLPSYREQGIEQQLIAAIKDEYAKVQSLWLLAMPLAQFLDAEQCESEQDKAFYQSIVREDENQTTQDVVEQYKALGFVALAIDASLLNEPLAFELMVAAGS